MSRFCRYSRISPLALCLEDERRAWRSAAGLLVLMFIGGVGALFCAAPERGAGGTHTPDFVGVAVAALAEAAAPEPPKEMPLPLLPPPSPEPELAVEACAPTELPPLPLLAEAYFPEQPDPLLAAELPEALAAPRRAAEPAAAAPAVAQPAVLQEEFLAAAYKSAPPPPYPPSLRNRRAEGRVGLRIFIDAEGVPQKVELCAPSGYAAFDRCAHDWVLAHWRFHPARRKGVAVASVIRTQLEFVLR